jgi:hypothetical protein
MKIFFGKKFLHMQFEGERLEKQIAATFFTA